MFWTSIGKICKSGFCKVYFSRDELFCGNWLFLLLRSVDTLHFQIQNLEFSYPCRALFKSVNKPDHSSPLKTLSPATTEKDEILLAAKTKKEKIYLFTTFTVPVFRKSLNQNKVDYLQKATSGLRRIVLPLILFIDELSVYAALVV